MCAHDRRSSTSGGVVFIHGGLHGSWCWDRVRSHIEFDSIAPDLSGRGTRPAPVHQLHVADFVRDVLAEIDASGWTRVVLAAHSLGGLTALGVAAARPKMVEHIVFISCVTPRPGTRPVDALRWPLRSYLTRRMRRAVAVPDGELAIPRWLARRFFCSDLDAADTRMVLERCVPDAPAALLDNTPPAPLALSVSRTWVRLTRDRAIPPRVQDKMLANVAPVSVVELAAGHDVMLSRPEQLARVVNRAASSALVRSQDETG